MSEEELRRKIVDLRDTLRLLIESVDHLHHKVDSIAENGCRLRQRDRREGTGPHLPNLFKEGTGE